MKAKFKIFVVFHDNIIPEYYDPSLYDHLVFINVTHDNPNVDKIRQMGFTVINQYELSKLFNLGKQYAESEVIYNIYKNPELISDIDYIGFVQYDMNTHQLSAKELESLMGVYNHIAFDEHSIEAEFKVGYLMDEKKPEKWIGRGKNCYINILNDYNSFYGSHFLIQDLLPKKINLCCAFFLKRDTFLSMMMFISEIIENKNLDKFDTKRKFRMQGGLLERYFGIWLTNNKTSYFYRPIEHVFNTTIATANHGLANRVISFIKRKIL